MAQFYLLTLFFTLHCDGANAFRFVDQSHLTIEIKTQILDSNASLTPMDIVATATLIKEVVQNILATPVVVTGKTAFSFYGTAVAEPTLVINKGKAQQALLTVDDLTYDIEVSASLTQDGLARQFDFAQSLKAFNNAEKRIWDQLKKILKVESPPISTTSCVERFSSDPVPLLTAVCEALCSAGSTCDCTVERLRPTEEILQTVMDDTGKSICDQWTTLIAGYADQSVSDRTLNLRPLWKRYVAVARTNIRQILANRFISPVVIAIASQKTVVKYFSDIIASCAMGSSWSNPLGKLGHGLRRVAGAIAAGARKADPRDIIIAKANQIRRQVHQNLCPAVRLAACRVAGCDTFSEARPGSWQACGDQEVEQFEQSGQGVPQFGYTEAYCKQMQDFASIISPICDNENTFFNVISKSASPALALAFDAMSIHGLASLAVMVQMWNDPSQLTNLAQVAVLAGAGRSVSYLLGRVAAGYQNASTACESVANTILLGRAGLPE